MTTDELARSDRETMLLISTFAMAQHDPSLWDKFLDRWFNDLERRAERDAEAVAEATASGRVAAAGNAQPGLHAAAFDHDAAFTEHT